MTVINVKRISYNLHLIHLMSQACDHHDAGHEASFATVPATAVSGVFLLSEMKIWPPSHDGITIMPAEAIPRPDQRLIHKSVCLALVYMLVLKAANNPSCQISALTDQFDNKGAAVDAMEVVQETEPAATC
jgi:hypothetical protein